MNSKDTEMVLRRVEEVLDLHRTAHIGRPLDVTEMLMRDDTTGRLLEIRDIIHNSFNNKS